jgi:L-amino acid N-acyltransferase YncA
MRAPGNRGAFFVLRRMDRFFALGAAAFSALCAQIMSKHGRGIGRALLERLLAEADARGCRQMIAVIGDSGQIASIALHRAAGFRMVGTFEAVGFKFDRWLDTVLMQRPLGPGTTTAP